MPKCSDEHRRGLTKPLAQRIGRMLIYAKLVAKTAPNGADLFQTVCGSRLLEPSDTDSYLLSQLRLEVSSSPAMVCVWVARDHA